MNYLYYTVNSHIIQYDNSYRKEETEEDEETRSQLFPHLILECTFLSCSNLRSASRNTRRHLPGMRENTRQVPD